MCCMLHCCQQAAQRCCSCLRPVHISIAGSSFAIMMAACWQAVTVIKHHVSSRGHERVSVSGTTGIHLQAVLLPKGSTDRLLIMAASPQSGVAAAQGALLLR